jgi:FkbM family methyltransferase
LLLNPLNWLALFRALYVFEKPLQLARAMLRRTAPESVVIHTPIGPLTVALRNFESLRTLFSIFCRLDYRTHPSEVNHFLDVGANVGIASLYFLSRNSENTVSGYEPDSANLDFLRRNLHNFAARATIHEYAVGVSAEDTVLYRSADGKYSSLLASERAVFPQQVATKAFADVLTSADAGHLPVVVKLDVEGMETSLVSSIRFQNYTRVVRLISESTECSELVTRPHRRTLRSGYVEDLRFDQALQHTTA